MTDDNPRIPPKACWADRLVLPAVIMAFVLTTAGFLMAFLTIPPVGGASAEGAALVGDTMVTQVMLLSQKIFYFHMPVAITSFGALVIGAVFAVRYLMTRDACYDLRSKVALEMALLFVVLTMITGEMWTRFEWGVWWTWEPRLTTYFVLMILVIAYFILRNAVDDPDKRAAYSAIVAIIACIDVPICLMITRLIPSSVHPVVLREGGMSAEMGFCVTIVAIGMLALAFALYRLRLRQLRVSMRTDELTERLESRRAS